MLYKFYGFTAPNVFLFNMSPRLYKKLLNSSNMDFKVLYLLDKQFNELENFLDSIRNEYVDRNDKKTYAKIRRLERDNPSSPEIAELKKLLENAEVDISSVYMVNGERVEISELSKSIILYLKKELNKIKTFHSQIDLSNKVVNEVSDSYFGIPLFRLRSYDERYLCTIFNTHFDNYIENNKSINNGKKFWTRLADLVDWIAKYVPAQDEEDVNLDLTESAISEVSEFVENLDYSSLDVLFGEHSEEEYHKSSLELHKIGLVGFTPFVKELFKEFKNVYNPSYVSKIYINQGSALFRFYTMCKRALESDLELFADLNPSSVNKDNVETGSVGDELLELEISDSDEIHFSGDEEELEIEEV